MASSLQVGPAAQQAQEAQDPVTALHFLASNVFRNTFWAAVLLSLFVTRPPWIPHPELPRVRASLDAPTGHGNVSLI